MTFELLIFDSPFAVHNLRVGYFVESVSLSEAENYLCDDCHQKSCGAGCYGPLRLQLSGHFQHMQRALLFHYSVWPKRKLSQKVPLYLPLVFLPYL
jgi:hypothetical protein